MRSSLGWALLAPAAALIALGAAYVALADAVCLAPDPDTGAERGGYEGAGNALAFGAPVVACLFVLASFLLFFRMARLREGRPWRGMIAAIATGAAAIGTFMAAVVVTSLACGSG